MSAAASAVMRNVTGACLGPVSGGTAINAIPSQARAVVAVSGSVGHGAKLGTEKDHLRGTAGHAELHDSGATSSLDPNWLRPDIMP